MNVFRRFLLQPALRRQTPKKPLRHKPVARRPKSDTKRSPGFLQETLARLQGSLLPAKVEGQEQPPEVAVTSSNFFTKLDEPLRFIFKVPFIQNFYMVWLRKEDVSLPESLKLKFYYIFLGELSFYSKLGIETFEKLIMTNYAEIMSSPDSRENLIILHHLVTRNKRHIEESLYQMERDKKTHEDGVSAIEAKDIVPPLSSRTYYKYIDLSVRPLFKFEVFQTIFGRWLRLEGISIIDSYDAHYHNLFLEELLYYYDQGEGFVRSIIKNIYVNPNLGDKASHFTEDDLNNIYMLIRTFDAILDETVKKLKENQGELGDIDKKQYLNHGYDFGMILYYVAVKDPFNALMTARGLVIDAASKIWETKEGKKKLELKKE